MLGDGTWLEDDDIDNIEYYHEDDHAEEAQPWLAGHEEPKISSATETPWPVDAPQPAGQSGIRAALAPQCSTANASEGGLNQTPSWCRPHPDVNAAPPDPFHERALRWIAEGRAGSTDASTQGTTYFVCSQ